jgi:hypothetical protein
LLFDVPRLVAHGNLRQARKIDESESENIWRKNPQIDRLWRYACILARLCFCIADDLISYFVKVEKFLPGKMEKLAPFVCICGLVFGLVNTVWLCCDAVRLYNSSNRVDRVYALIQRVG